MSLFDRDAFEAFIGSLAHTEIVHQWGDASVGKIGPKGSGKIFVILSSWSADRPAISFKCSPVSFQMLCELEGIRPAPYLARAQWVQANAECPFARDDLAAYIAQAHTIVFARLPGKVRASLEL